MRKLLMTTALLAALAGSAQAEEQFSNNDVLTTASVIVLYNQACSPVPASMKMVDILGAGASQADLQNAAGPVMRAYVSMGHDKFCTSMKPSVEAIEASAH